MKKLVLLSLFFITGGVFADGGVFWHCTATNDKGAVWNQYGESHQKTRSMAQRACEAFNDRKPCEMVCFPPRTYWRCMAHDLTPPVKDAKKGAAPVKPGTWYWTSFSKQIAINGARDACRHNSQYGGCFVDADACATSDNTKGE